MPGTRRNGFGVACRRKECYQARLKALDLFNQTIETSLLNASAWLSKAETPVHMGQNDEANPRLTTRPFSLKVEKWCHLEKSRIPQRYFGECNEIE